MKAHSYSLKETPAIGGVLHFFSMDFLCFKVFFEIIISKENKITSQKNFIIMRENLKKNVFIIWNVFSKIAIISISITSKLVDWIFPIFITLLVTCLIYPHKFEDFILFFCLIYRDYKYSVSLFIVFLVLCFITKQIEKNIGPFRK